MVRGDTELPVGFFSRILKGPEQRYSVSEKEALAVLSCLDHFDIYLFGRLVTVKTDHKPNLALVSGSLGSTLNPRLRRFSLKLQGRVDQMLYVPGEELTNADGFSRIWSEEDILPGTGQQDPNMTGGQSQDGGGRDTVVPEEKELDGRAHLNQGGVGPAGATPIQET